MVGLGDLPGRTFFSLAAGISMDGSTIAGNSEADFGNQAFRWTAQTGLVGLPDLPGGEIYSQAHGISPDGSVIVGISSGAIETIGVYWTTDGSIVPLGLMPGGTWTRPKDASLNGEIIVGLGRLPGRDAAMIWDAEHGVRNLESVLATDYGLDLTGWQLTAANGISADGRVIAGTGVNPQGHAEGWVAIIPEPATAIAIGVVGAIWIRRRR